MFISQSILLLILILNFLMVFKIQGATIIIIDEQNDYIVDNTHNAYQSFTEGSDVELGNWVPIHPTTNQYYSASLSAPNLPVTINCNKDGDPNNYLYALQWPSDRNFKRKVTITPPHYDVRITIGIVLYARAQYAAGDYFQMWVDDDVNTPYSIWQRTRNQQITNANYCSDWWEDTQGDATQNDGFYETTVTITDHESDTIYVELKFIQHTGFNVNTYQLRWGVYKFQVEYDECDPTCLTCNGPNPNDCLTCQSTPTQYYLDGVGPTYTCVTDCSGNQYPDNSSGNLQCVTCHSRCAECTSNTYTSCSVCNAGYYLKLPSTCELICTNNCLTCQTTPTEDASKCLTCSDPLFLMPPSFNCVTTCQLGWYGVVQIQYPFRKCFECNTACNSCTSEFVCDDCNLGYFLYDSFCIPECPDGYYENTINDTCVQCHANCKTCNGPTLNDCIECADGLYYHYVDSLCYTVCPISYYYNDSTSPKQCSLCANMEGIYEDQFTNICEPCGNNCRKCVNGVGLCSDCYGDRFLDTVNEICWRCEDTVGLITNPSNPFRCEEICGDGIRVSENTECDDGNNAKGDGCSHTCEVESGYICVGGTPNTPDICVDKSQITFEVIESDAGKDFLNEVENDVFVVKILFSKNFSLESGNISDYLTVSLTGGHVTDDFYIKIKQNPEEPREFTITFEFYRTIRYQTMTISFSDREKFRDVAGNILADVSVQVDIQNYFYQTDEQRIEVASFKILLEVFVVMMFIWIVPMILTNNYYLIAPGLENMQTIYFIGYINFRQPINSVAFNEKIANFRDFYIPNPFYSKPVYGIYNEKKVEYGGQDPLLFNNIGSIFLMFLVIFFIYAVTKFMLNITWKKLLDKRWWQKTVKILKIIVYEFFEYRFWNDFWQMVYLIIAAFCYLNFQGFDSTSVSSYFAILLGFICFFTPLFYWTQIYLKRNHLYFEKVLGIGERRGNVDYRMQKDNFKWRTFWSYLRVQEKPKTLYYLPFLFLRKLLYAAGFVLLNYNLDYQIYALGCYNTFYLILFAYFRPFKEFRHNLKVIITEALIITSLILTKLIGSDNGEDEMERYQNTWDIIYCLFSVLIIHLVFLYLEVSIYIRYVYQRRKLEKMRVDIIHERRHQKEEIKQEKRRKKEERIQKNREQIEDIVVPSLDNQLERLFGVGHKHENRFQFKTKSQMDEEAQKQKQNMQDDQLIDGDNTSIGQQQNNENINNNYDTNSNLQFDKTQTQLDGTQQQFRDSQGQLLSSQGLQYENSQSQIPDSVQDRQKSRQPTLKEIKKKQERRKKEITLMYTQGTQQKEVPDSANDYQPSMNGTQFNNNNSKGFNKSQQQTKTSKFNIMPANLIDDNKNKFKSKNKNRDEQLDYLQEDQVDSNDSDYY